MEPSAHRPKPETMNQKKACSLPTLHLPTSCAAPCCEQNSPGICHSSEKLADTLHSTLETVSCFVKHLVCFLRQSLTLQSKLVLNSQHCSCILNAKITGTSHHPWLSYFLNISCEVKSRGETRSWCQGGVFGKCLRFFSSHFPTHRMRKHEGSSEER